MHVCCDNAPIPDTWRGSSWPNTKVQTLQLVHRGLGKDGKEQRRKKWKVKEKPYDLALDTCELDVWIGTHRPGFPLFFIEGVGNVRDSAQALCWEEDGLPWMALLLSFHNREIQGNSSSSGICPCDTWADIFSPTSVWVRLSQYSQCVFLFSSSWSKSV